MDIDKIIEKLKKDTNNASDITYREKKVWKKRTEIIYIESLTNSDKISDFIIRSLDKIDKYITKKNLYTTIINDIENFKYTEITSYKDISYYLNYGFTIILIKGEDKAIALETKGELNRSNKPRLN